MANKWTKALLALAAAGAAVGGAIAYKKYREDFADAPDEEFEDEDFDADLTDTSSREYVTLNLHPEEKDTNAADDTSEEPEADADADDTPEAPEADADADDTPEAPEADADAANDNEA